MVRRDSKGRIVRQSRSKKVAELPNDFESVEKFSEYLDELIDGVKVLWKQLYTIDSEKRAEYWEDVDERLHDLYQEVWLVFGDLEDIEEYVEVEIDLDEFSLRVDIVLTGAEGEVLEDLKQSAEGSDYKFEDIGDNSVVFTKKI